MRVLCCVSSGLVLFVCFVKVSSAIPLEKREFPGTEPGQTPPTAASTTTIQLLEAARRAAASLALDTGRVSDKVLWSVGKVLLSASESINYVWDVALHASVRLLKAGGAACDTVAGRLAHVPVIGFGASGVREAVGAAVDAVASNVAHDMRVRSQAFAALNAKLNESGARLRPATDETGGLAPADAATDPHGHATFFPRH